MNGYFYHGIEFYPGVVGRTIRLLIKILDEGLVFRNQAGGYEDEEFNHICLYKKNDDYDYNKEDALIHSARGGWIDRQFVFIIGTNIDAKKAELGRETDLVDEWRCYQNILPTNFVGIGLPLDTINEYLNEPDYGKEETEDKRIVIQYLPILIKKAHSMGLSVENSDQPNFTDNIDKKNSNRVL